MNRKPAILLSGLALSAAVALAGCGKGRGAAPAPEAPAKTAEKVEEPATPQRVHLTAAAIAEAGITTWKVQIVDLSHLLSLTGSVGYDENRLLQVAANVKGRVTSIPVDLGARVKPGDPLLVIESVDLGRTREEFVTELSSFNVSATRLRASQEARRGECDQRRGVPVARRRLPRAKKPAVASAERTLHLYGDSEEAIARLRSQRRRPQRSPPADGATLTLRAPFAGRVIDRKVTPGALFEALQPLMTIADLGSVWVFLNAYEKDLALLHEGLSVTLRTDAYPQETFRGRVDFLGSVVDPQTRSVRVRATVENRAGEAPPGLFVKAQVDVPKPQSEAHPIVAVPQAAHPDARGAPDRLRPGRARRLRSGTSSRSGTRFEGFTEILAGIKPGDVVVTEGSFVLKSEFAKASLVEED